MCQNLLESCQNILEFVFKPFVNCFEYFLILLKHLLNLIKTYFFNIYCKLFENFIIFLQILIKIKIMFFIAFFALSPLSKVWLKPCLRLVQLYTHPINQSIIQHPLKVDTTSPYFEWTLILVSLVRVTSITIVCSIFAVHSKIYRPSKIKKYCIHNTLLQLRLQPTRLLWTIENSLKA